MGGNQFCRVEIRRSDRELCYQPCANRVQSPSVIFYMNILQKLLRKIEDKILLNRINRISLENKEFYNKLSQKQKDKLFKDATKRMKKK